jgi:hypothetical protein
VARKMNIYKKSADTKPLDIPLEHMMRWTSNKIILFCFNKIKEKIYNKGLMSYKRTGIPCVTQTNMNICGFYGPEKVFSIYVI